MRTMDHHIIGIEIKRSGSDYTDHMNDHEVLDLLRQLKTRFEEAFVLSTCQRLTVFVYHKEKGDLAEFFNNINVECQSDIFFSTLDSTRHLFEIASGLHSLVIGEHEILGQIRKSLSFARRENAIGPHLEEFVRHAIQCGKKVRSNTAIGSYNISYPSIGLKLVNEQFFDLNGLTFLVLGTGELARNFLNALSGISDKNVIVLSHNLFRAEKFGSEFGAKADKLEQLDKYINKAHVIIGGTHGEVDYSLLYEREDVCPRHLIRKLKLGSVIIDYGMPSNFPGLEDYSGYFNLEDIMEMARVNDEKRRTCIPMVNEIIEEEVNFFEENHKNRKLSFLYGKLWNNLEAIKEREVEWLKPKMTGLSDQEVQLLERFTNKIMRSVAKGSFDHIRQNKDEILSNPELANHYLQLFK